jgi:hypothetical protein
MIGRTWLGLAGLVVCMMLAPAPGADAQVQATPKGQSPPARDWPPGWKLYEPYPEELTFVAPRATTKVASDVRTLRSDITDEHKFKGAVMADRILIDNPYLDPDDPFFGVPRQIACLSDGSVAVSSTARLYKEGRFAGNPYATGFWRIAPDGAITPIAAKSSILENSPYYPVCGMPYSKTKIRDDIRPMALAPDGSLLFPHESSILRLTPGGHVEHVPNRAEFCAADNRPKEPFNQPDAAAQDPRGNVWVADGCTLWRMTLDGAVTQVLGDAQMCPAGEPEHWIRGSFLAWDAVHDELVMSGGVLWLKAPKTNYYSMIHRVKPDGTPRRVFLGVKVGRSAFRVDGTGGLAIDSKGTIYFGAGIPGGGYQVMRLDETRGAPVLVAGAPLPSNVNHGDGPARQAHFERFRSMCIAPDGTLFMNDTNNVIRKLTPAGQVTTWAF